MDYAVVIGISICVLMIIFGIIFSEGRLEIANIKMFFDFSSFLIVAGGSIGATLTAITLREGFQAITIVREVLKPPKIDWQGTVKLFAYIANEARREGVLSLQNKVDRQENDLIKSGLQLIVDGADCDVLFQVIGTKIQIKKNEDKLGVRIFSKMGSIAPAFGMLGTVMGLIQVVANLSEPEKLGGGIALAFITTFYGIILANVVFNPIAEKLNRNNEEKSTYYEMILTGLQSILEGDNPFIVEEKLKAFFPVSARPVPAVLVNKKAPALKGKKKYGTTKLQTETS